MSLVRSALLRAWALRASVSFLRGGHAQCPRCPKDHEVQPSGAYEVCGASNQVPLIHHRIVNRHKRGTVLKSMPENDPA